MVPHVLVRAWHGMRHGAWDNGQFSRLLHSVAAMNNQAPNMLDSMAELRARVSSHDQASASGSTATPSMQLYQHAAFGHQSFRGIKVLRRQFELPPEIKAIMDRKLQETKQSRPAVPLVELAPRTLTAESIRAGCIAYKAGMTQDWDEHGVRVPLTVLWVDDCQVVGVKTTESYGYTALQLGAGHLPPGQLKSAAAGYFNKQGVPAKEKLVEFQVSQDALLPVGTHITAAHYVAGQHVDVTGWTKWKGFQGVMKRWNFKGLPASHGVSLSHRAPGSIGNRADPGKVWKGKKMPGHMGDERRTVRNCLVYKVDPARNLVYVRGQVPGPAGQVVLLRDTRVPHEQRAQLKLPFPTLISAAAGDKKEEAAITVARNPKDPYKPYSAETDYFEVRWKKGD